MNIKNFLLNIFLILTFIQFSHANNHCSKYFPLPNDGVVVIIPICNANSYTKRIFIIGSSTVHAEWYSSARFTDYFGHNRVLEGWGEELDKYMKEPSKVYNRARSGSHSIRYRNPDDSNPGRANRHWDNTEALIHQTDDGNGGFLLIQFGAAEAYDNDVSVDDFKNELRAYVADARRLGLIPVLISPPGARSHGTNTRPYAIHVKDIAMEANIDVLHINLYEKSKIVWQTYAEDAQGNLPEADTIFSYLEHRDSNDPKSTGGINNTHFGRNGAKIVAGWVRELACESYNDRSVAVQNVAKELCKQFVQGELKHPIIMREDAEDGDTQDWERYATTAGSTVTNVYDEDKRSNVIQLQGNDGLSNGFRYSRQNLWEEENHHVISWEMKYNEDFTFFVSVDTEDGYKTFEYKPTNSTGSIVSGRYRFGVGNDTNDNTWHTFTRDLQADLQVVAPGKHILKIHRIAIRGSGRVDNIRTIMSVDSVSRDIAPTVAVKGEAEITVNKDSIYVDPGVTVVDDNDVNIQDQLERVGLDSVDTNTVGSYTILYKVHDSVGNGGYATRVVNVVDTEAEVVTMHEDAENGDTVGWNTYATTAGSTIENVLDNGNHVIALHGNNGLNNGFSFSGLNITEGFVTSWRLKYTNNFRFFVQVRSLNSPDSNIYMEYTPDNISRGLNGSFIHNGLGTDANDGLWHTFTRDIEADFNVVYPNDTITRIVGFSIRGSGRLDDISTSTRAGLETFSYNGHNYKIVKNKLSWQDASTAAHADGGYLTHIDSIAENHEVYSRLYRFIAKNEYANTVASNGGGASYVWLGGNDLTTEDSWVWEDNNAQFWQGRANGNVVGELYNNWGKNTYNNEAQREPDNVGNQDALGMSLTEWQVGSGTLGQASQWNDLIASDVLYSIVEYDNPQVIVLDILKAFPTAEGAGAGTSGGRGGDVVYVTNRDADGNGSLRAALRTDRKRTIVFAIGGRFNVDRSIFLGQWKRNRHTNDSFNEDFDKYSNFTLAGQTANDKGGVHLATSRTDGSERSFSVGGQENMILRYFDSRYNWHFFYREGDSQSHQPTLRFVDVNNLIIDHVTSGWSSYGFIITNYTLTPRKILGNITVQRSLVHEGTMIPANIDANQHNHNVGMLLGRSGHGGEYDEWNMMGEFSILKNAYIGVSHRFPNIAGSDNAKFQIINNYMYGFLGDSNVRIARTAGNSENDFINNVFQRTLYSPEFTNSNLLAYDFGNFMPNEPEPLLNNPNFYISGNIFLSPLENVLNITNQIQNNPRLMLYRWQDTTGLNYPAGNLNEEDHHLTLRGNPTDALHAVSILPANEVKKNILNNVGGNIRFTEDGTAYIDDIKDEMYINEWAKNNGGPVDMDSFKGTTALGNSVRFTYPEFNTQPAVDLNFYDTDKDGMPNTWELAHHLDPDVANNNAVRTNRHWDFDPYVVINNAGYTDLEMYLADVAGDFHMLALNKSKRL